MTKRPEGIPHDARDRLWAVATPPDMLAKLGWEMSTLFDALKQNDVRVAAYFALNGCLTAWHITDWLVRALDTKVVWRTLGVSLMPRLNVKFGQRCVKCQPLLLAIRLRTPQNTCSSVTRFPTCLVTTQVTNPCPQSGVKRNMDCGLRRRKGERRSSDSLPRLRMVGKHAPLFGLRREA